MRVTELSAEPLDLPLTEPFAIAGAAPSVAHNVLVRLRLDDGTLGLGEAAPFPAVTGETQAGTLDALNALRPAVIGRDPADWRRLGEELDAAAPGAAAARCAIEIALLDAFAKTQDQPLWRIFGGRGTTLSSDITITAGDLQHAERAARAAADYSIIKVKVGAGSVEEDLLRLEAVHRGAPDASLTADANCGYDLARARAFLAGVGDRGLPLVLFEQPLRPADDALLPEIAASIAVCADESAKSAADVERLAGLGVACVNLKVMKSGVSRALSMMEAARRAGIGLMIGGMVESILAMSFSASLAAGSGGFSFVDLDTPLWIAQHPFKGGFVQKGEQLELSSVSRGHGVEVA